ncbi:MAG TPA: tetratricopeptide repeat protein [Terriglobales bacterium]|nr:tetratricopeptide repeat protein [Terriglobales bacterium]
MMKSSYIDHIFAPTPMFPRTLFLVLALAASVSAQTFEIGGQQSQPQSQPQAAGKKAGKSAAQRPQQQEESGIGTFGESIAVQREQRAADDALRHNNAAAAYAHAKRAVEMAPGDQGRWFTLGYAARLSGHLSDSENAYKRGLQISPGAAEGLSGLAQTYFRMGRVNDAKRMLLDVIAKYPNRVDDQMMAGELFMQSGDIQQAIQILQHAEQIKPSAHSELLMAIGYMKLKDTARAKQLLDLARRRDPNNIDIFRAVANFQRESHDYQGAIATLKSAPSQKPDLLADLGYTYELAGMKQEAADTYTRYANADSKNINAQLSAAQAWMRLNDSAQTQQFIDRAATIDSNHYRLHAVRAGFAKMQNKDAVAATEYEAALAHMPEDVPEGQMFPIELRLNLSETYKGLGNRAAAQQQIALAEQEINKIQVEGPQRAEFLRVRASIAIGGNDYNAAEKDLLEAMKLDPNNSNIELQYANLLWIMQKKAESEQVYLAVLKHDPRNRYAYESLGYLMRDSGKIPQAEQYFHEMAKLYPDDYVPYLALGDMYTSLDRLDEAQNAYEQGYKLAPQNAAIIAGGSNAAIQNHKFPLATAWVHRSTPAMMDDPRIQREWERVVFFEGKYRESAQFGYKVLAQRPTDLDGAVYLAYSLYNLGRYDDTLALTSRYQVILPKESNFPLLEGHVHKQQGLLDKAVDDYGRALQRDPKMTEAYVNRGYVLNDLQDAEAAIADFDQALKLQPNNGSAHLGAAFSNLELHRSRAALEQATQAEKLLGKLAPIHEAKATAYRQLRQLQKAETEYRAAIALAPSDVALHIALADTLYYQHKYRPTIDQLTIAIREQPDDPFLYAQRAHAEAQLKMRAETLQDVKFAEEQGSDQGAVLLATGDALLLLGETDAAQQRFTRALDAPDANRVQTRLAFARLFANQHKFDDARQQVSLGFTEARVGEATPATADDLVAAGNIFLSMNDFDLAQKLYERAKESGAAEEQVAIGMANVALAQGDDRQAEQYLASLGSRDQYVDNYDYMLAEGAIYRMRHDMPNAVNAFARANALAPENENLEVQRSLHEAAGEQGIPVNSKMSVLSDFSVAPVFDDATIYVTDAKIFGLSGNSAQLPSGRRLVETQFTQGYRYHTEGAPVVSGFFQLDHYSGNYSLPFASRIVETSTNNYNFNGGISPVLRVGSARFEFNTGLQFTVRRDSNELSKFDVNQNLFRQFVFLSSSPLFNALTIRGQAYHESGPFTLQNLSSGEKGARIDFTVGRPWGKNALVTGYTVRDLQFSPIVSEWFTTSSYIGFQRKFGQKLTVTPMVEMIRSWKVQAPQFARAQVFMPAGTFEYRPTERWTVNGNFAWQSGRGKDPLLHAYDNVQSGIYISYLRPLRQNQRDGLGEFAVEYPIRFSVGIQQQNFFNLAGHGQTEIVPVVRLTLF